MFSVMRFWPAKGQRIGKRFGLDEAGGLVSDPEVLLPSNCFAERLDFASFADLHRYILKNEHENYCFTYGLAPAGKRLVFAQRSAVTQEARLEIAGGDEDLAKLPVMSRTNRFLGYESGELVLSIDTDPAGTPVPQDEVLRQIEQVVPTLASAACIGFASSSSHLFAPDGRELRGPGGVRHLFAAKYETADTQFRSIGVRPLMRLVHDRMIIAGHYTAKVDGRGLLVLKTPIDLALYRPTQPDFVGSPVLDDGIERRRPPICWRDGATVDLRDIAARTDAEVEALREIRAMETERLRDEMAEKAASFREKQIGRAVARGVERREAEIRHDAAVRRGGTWLSLDHEIHLDVGRWVTGREIIARPQEYDGLSCASPIEPYYESRDGNPTRGKGKLVIRGGQIGVIDYARGAFEFYRFDDTRDFEELFAEGGEPEKAAEADPEPSERIDEAPEHPERLFSMRTLDDRDSAGVRALVARGGVVTVVGRALAGAAFREWVNQKGAGQIWVTSYQDAVAARDAVRRLAPAARVSIMPGRTADADSLRARFGRDVLSFHTHNGAVAGLDDEICMKRSAVKVLLDRNYQQIFGAACRAAGGDPDAPKEVRGDCPHIDECGYMARYACAGASDFLIRITTSAQGDANPLLTDEALAGAFAVFNLTSLPPASCARWPLAMFRTHPVLERLLAFIEARSINPEAPRPKLLAAELHDWAGSPGMVPSQTAHKAAEAADAFAAVTKKKTLGGPPPHELVAQVEAYLRGNGSLMIVGDHVEGRRHQPLNKLGEAVSLLNVAGSMEAPLSIAALRSVVAEVEGEVERPYTARVGAMRWPSRIVQLLDPPKERSASPGKFLRTASPGGTSPRAVRDLTAFAIACAAEKGSGIVVVPDAEMALGTMGAIDGATYVGEAEITFANLLSDRLPPEAVWAIWIGRSRPSDRSILDRLAMMPRDEWPESLVDPAVPVTRKLTTLFRMRDGQWTRGDAWRWAGADERADLAFVNCVAEPTLLLAQWLGDREHETGVPRELYVAHSFPLAHPAAPQGSLPLDAVEPLLDFLPSAAALLKLSGAAATNGQAAERLGVSVRQLQQERGEGDDADRIRDIFGDKAG